jgi:hypothetical protein
MREARAAIDFRIRKPVAEIPKDGVAHPYAKLFRALVNAPKDAPIIPVMCASEEDAVLLAGRLAAYFKANAIVRKPRGSRCVYIAAKGAVPKRVVRKVPKLARRKKK